MTATLMPCLKTGNSLKELGVPEDLITEAANIAESVRNDILNR